MFLEFRIDMRLFSEEEKFYDFEPKILVLDLILSKNDQ